MQQRDILKDQIEQAGKVLGKILADFLNLKSNTNETLAFETAKEELKIQMDVDMELLFSLNVLELRSYFAERNFSTHHMEQLADFLSGLKDNSQNQKLALRLLTLIDDISETLDLGRLQKQEQLKRVLADQA